MGKLSISGSAEETAEQFCSPDDIEFEPTRLGLSGREPVDLSDTGEADAN